MAKRHNHYEAAFEDYLRQERLPYVAIDERRRALAPEGSLKSADYIVSTQGSQLPVGSGGLSEAARWLVDVKGRRFPSSGQYWRNWTTVEELRSLAGWAERFGSRFEAVLVFAYLLVGDRSPVAVEQIHYWRDRPYGLIAVRAVDYAAHARPLSPKWGTVAVRAADFRQIARPLTDWLGETEQCSAPEKRSVPAERLIQEGGVTAEGVGPSQLTL